jgi:lactosylceramide 4-alpha-galactosyltransferase
MQRRRCLTVLVGLVLAWLLIVHVVASPSMSAWSPRCLPLPMRWSRLHNETQYASKAPAFVLLWSTNVTSFTLRSRRCLESIVYHHPRSTVRIYSNELPLDFFSNFQARGFDLRVVRYNAHELLQGTPAAPWLERLEEWRAGPYYYSHVTDAIRLALLFKVGGVYLDTDVLVSSAFRLSPSPRLAPSDGTAPMQAERARANGERRALHDALGIESFADPRTGQLTLNGAVMAFERGSRFLWNALDEFATNYRAAEWSWNGPELLTRVQARCAASGGAVVQVEPPETFYPLHWKQVEEYADGRHTTADAEMWKIIEKRSYAVHVWNRKTAGLRFAKGSLLYRLHNEWTVLPSREACT